METWKDIEGYNGFYQVSNHGNMRSRYLGLTNLKLQVDKDGYFKISLMKDRKQKRYMVHRLVAMAFIPNPENKPCINHKDGDKKNNHVSNLEWVTISENTKHAFDNGLCVQKYGYHSCRAKLDKKDLEFIRYLRSKGLGYRRISKLFTKVSPQTISNILSGKTYNRV